MIMLPIKDGLNDRNDRLYHKIIRICLSLISNNSMEFRTESFQKVFEEAINIYITARSPQTKLFVKNLKIRLFELITQRLKLLNQIKRNNANIQMTMFQEGKKFIKEECMLTILNLVNNIEVDIQQHDSDKESVKSNNEIDHTQNSSGDITNSINLEILKNGKYGICYMCYKSADYYCKDTSKPVCSLNCKFKLLSRIKYEEELNLSIQKYNIEEKKINDSYLILFRQMAQICFDKKYEKDRIVFLEILHQLIKSPSVYLKKDLKFIEFLRTELFPDLLRIALVSENQILKSALVIFLNLIVNFREHLKVEIGIFLKDVFMKTLDSFNSKFNVKFYLLQVLTALIEEKSIIIEFFLNYDCDAGGEDLCQQTIELLVRTAQGKFTKNVYSGLINSSEELELRKEASQGIISLIQGLQNFEQTEIKNNNYEQQDGEAVLSKRRVIEDAIKKFNIGNKKATKELIELEIIENDSAEALCNFLKNNKRVEQTIIGEIFGRDDKFSQDVLKLFLQSMDFSNQDLASSLRFFLSLFEMPGEGQKVERILETFSSRYVECNPGNLSNDSTYMLSFLLMMAQTSIHNPKVLEKMTLQQFLSIGGNIKENGKTIETLFLEKLFREVELKPLAIHSSERRKQEIQKVIDLSNNEKQELFKQESEKVTLALSSQSMSQSKKYNFISSSNILPLFFKTIWSSLLSFLSTSVVECNDLVLLSRLAETTVFTILLCDKFDMNTERDSFVNLLIQFSGLELGKGKLLDDKNRRFIKEIISIGESMGSHLNSAWRPVLSCLFILMRFFRISEKLRNKKSAEQSSVALSIEEQNAVMIFDNFECERIDRIFLDTKLLSEDSLLSFFKGLCDVSIYDIERQSQYFDLTLEKLIVVVQVNANRNPLEWIRVWEILSYSLEKIICTKGVSGIPSQAYRIRFAGRLILCSLEVI